LPVAEYLAEVDRLEAAEAAEQKAKEMFDGGDEDATSLVQVMDKVNKAQQLPLFYSGGFRVLASLLTDGEFPFFNFNSLGARSHIRLRHHSSTVVACSCMLS
jgi:hypothetical protein